MINEVSQCSNERTVLAQQIFANVSGNLRGQCDLLWSFSPPARQTATRTISTGRRVALRLPFVFTDLDPFTETELNCQEAGARQSFDMYSSSG